MPQNFTQPYAPPAGGFTFAPPAVAPGTPPPSLDTDYEGRQRALSLAELARGSHYGIGADQWGQADAASRTGQQGQIDYLSGIATGAAKSPAEVAYEQELRQSMAAQYGAARGARGGTYGIASRDAANNAATMQQGGISEAAIIHAQQQQAAEQGLAATLAAQRTGDATATGAALGGEAGQYGIGQRALGNTTSDAIKRQGINTGAFGAETNIGTGQQIAANNRFDSYLGAGVGAAGGGLARLYSGSKKEDGATP